MTNNQLFTMSGYDSQMMDSMALMMVIGNGGREEGGGSM